MFRDAPHMCIRGEFTHHRGAATTSQVRLSQQLGQPSAKNGVERIREISIADKSEILF
jgi:hypothetical protein